ncbi:MAG: DUF6785 family protein [Armatimonadota bacterium]|nr:DUF6785 family protein [Armatimonadota bacterium]
MNATVIRQHRGELARGAAREDQMHEQISDVQPSGPPDAEARPATHVRIITMLVLSIGLTWLAGYWIRQGEIIALSAQMTEAVPSIPGLTALLVLAGASPLLRRLPYVRDLSAGEIIVVYLFVTVATFMFGCGVTRFLIATVSAPWYYSTPVAPTDTIAPHIPSWLSPPELIYHKWLYEASPTGEIPWEVWRIPVVVWTGFFVLFGGTLMCLMILFAEQWIEHERLVFPLVRLPLEILGEEGATPLFRNPITWIGMGIATVLNFYLMSRAVFFGGPKGTLNFDISRGITDYPFRAIRPMNIDFRPGLIGLGYLISTELSFSIWFFYLFQKLQALVMASVGYRVGGMPFAQEQGIGAYLVMGGVLLWKGREAIRHAWRSLLRPALGRGDRLPYRWALLGAIVGFTGLFMFFVTAGMAPWLAGLYLSILVIVGVVYGRLRAETGVPILWAFPYGQQHKVIWNFLGQEGVVGPSSDLRSPTIFAMMGFLSRGYFPTVSGYQIEGLHLAQRTKVHWRQIVTTLLLAVAVGAVFAFVFHLQPYYEEGGVGLRGGIWGAGTARQEYTNVLRARDMPAPPDTPRIIATIGGGLLVAAISIARGYWFGFPLHPIGYVLAGAFGHKLWGPFLVVWICKTILLRYGGSQSYLRALPGFLGFAVGHFITAGLIWGSLGAALGGPFLRWGVWFG